MVITFASITDGATSGLADIGYWTKDGSTTEAAGLDGTCYVEIDLGENFDVYELRVVNYVDDSPRYYQWEAYATTDNTLAIAEWTKIGEKTDTAVSTAEGTTVAFDATAMRYIRVYGTFHSANVGYHFAEIFAYADVESTFEGDSGAVSDTINWAIDSGYNLTITGTGAMPDYAAETDRPWMPTRHLPRPSPLVRALLLLVNCPSLILPVWKAFRLAIPLPLWAMTALPY